VCWATLASLLARSAPGLRFNEYMDHEDGLLRFDSFPLHRGRRPYMTHLGSGVCIAAVEMMLICVGRGLDPCSKPPLGPIKALV
jgi:hypothetical protein